DLLRLTAGFHRVELAVVREGKRAVLRAGEKAHGMLCKVCDRGRFVGMSKAAFIHIKAAALLAEVVKIVVVRVEDRIAVLALETRQLSVFFRRDVVHPNVSSDGRGVVFSPVALVTLVVVKDDLIAR